MFEINKSKDFTWCDDCGSKSKIKLAMQGAKCENCGHLARINKEVITYQCGECSNIFKIEKGDTLAHCEKCGEISLLAKDLNIRCGWCNTEFETRPDVGYCLKCGKEFTIGIRICCPACKSKLEARYAETLWWEAKLRDLHAGKL